MNTPLIIGNLKSYLVSREEVEAYFAALGEARAALSEDVRMGVAMPGPYIRVAKKALVGKALVGAQDVSEHGPGAHTGEVSAKLLASEGIDFSLVGHSERRAEGETDAMIAKKVRRLLDANMMAVVCVGETREERERGKSLAKIQTQISALLDVKPAESERIVIAYEPVWAVGSDDTPSTKDVREVVSGIREVLREMFGERSGNVPVLYGGSVNVGNIRELCIDSGAEGALVGRASLDAEGFVDMAKELKANKE